MDKARIAEIRAREQKATKGPWVRHGVRAKLGAEACITVGPEFPIAYLPIGSQQNDKYHAEAFRDGDFLAHARQDIPDLLTALEEAQAEVERLRAVYHDIGNTVLNVMETTEDEGDRVYFSSTNDADMLKDLGSKYHEWRMNNALKDTSHE